MTQPSSNERIYTGCTDVRGHRWVRELSEHYSNRGEPLAEYCDRCAVLWSNVAPAGKTTTPQLSGQDFDKDLAHLDGVRKTMADMKRHGSLQGIPMHEAEFLLSFIDNLWREYSKLNNKALDALAVKASAPPKPQIRKACLPCIDAVPIVKFHIDARGARRCLDDEPWRDLTPEEQSALAPMLTGAENGSGDAP